MFTAYTNLPNDARLWIYQSNREFTEKEVAYIAIKSEDFINQWTRHGDDLKGSFMIKYNHFLVLAVDETFNTVSGCSIDSSVRFIKELEKELNLDLMDKMNVTYYNGDFIAHKSLIDFKKMAKDRSVTGNTVVFNNLVTTKAEYENYWEVPASESWHGQFMK
jgi:hypothetical protein